MKLRASKNANLNKQPSLISTQDKPMALTLENLQRLDSLSPKRDAVKLQLNSSALPLPLKQSRTLLPQTGAYIDGLKGIGSSHYRETPKVSQSSLKRP